MKFAILFTLMATLSLMVRHLLHKFPPNPPHFAEKSADALCRSSSRSRYLAQRLRK